MVVTYKCLKYICNDATVGQTSKREEGVEGLRLKVLPDKVFNRHDIFAKHESTS